MADARQQRTRQAVFEAFDKLLAQKPYLDVNVKDLALQAGIGRQTFYRHFDNVDAVLRERLRGELADQMKLATGFAAGYDPDEWFHQVIRFAFERVAAQPRLSRVILRGEAGADVLQLFRDQIVGFWELAQADGPLSSASPELRPFVASFYAGAISAVLLHWIEAGCSPDAHIMSRLCFNLAKHARAD